MSTRAVRLPLLAIMCLVACAGRNEPAYDPIADVPSTHTVYRDVPSAIGGILAAEHPRIFAIGEYHPSRATASVRAPMERFTHDIIGLLAPSAHELVVETWYDDCGSASLRPQLEQAIQRPASTAKDMEHLAMRSQRLAIHPRALSITCLEHQAMRDATGSIDFFRLLQLVTTKLAEATHDAMAGDQRVVVYGGALHNDLYPRWPLDGLSYAERLERELGDGSVVELDLVVPEVVAPMLAIRLEPWFPLLGLASPDRTIVWRRGPHSFVVILPAQSDAVAKIAKLPSA